MKYLPAYLLSLLFMLCYLSGFAQKRVACIGDSVTKGYGIGLANDSYPAQLQKLLGEGYLVGNFGFNGATLLNKGHRPYTQTTSYQEALAFKPDIIVVSLGLNDTDPRNWPNYQGDFERDYHRLIAAFRAENPALEVFICTLTPIFSGHSRFLSGTRDWFDQLQATIPAIAKAQGATLIDNHSPLAARIDLFSDFLHPNQQGARILATQVFQSIAPQQAAPRSLRIDRSLGAHMVLQRGVKNRISGSAKPFEKIQLTLGKWKLETATTAKGSWEIYLPSIPAGGPYTLKVQDSANDLILEDILFGDVYLASGQSNMAFPLKGALASDTLIAQAAAKSQIRIFKETAIVETTNSRWDSLTLTQVNDLHYFQGQWERATAANIGNFSAIAYSFAESLQKEAQVPIGIIELAVGGSNTESWIPRKTLEDDNLLAPYIHNWQKSDFIQEFCRERAAVNLALSTNPNQRHPYAPAYNFEAGVTPWLSTNLKAVLWYQGESNAHNITLHSHLFRTLVQSWRTTFKQQLPFFVVQLSSLNRPSWPEFRNQQRLLTNEIAGTYLAVSTDLGDSTDVHPRHKIPVGQRLAKLALQHIYGKKNQANSPQPVTISQEPSLLIVTFNNCEKLETTRNEAIKGLQLIDFKGEIHTPTNVQITHNKLYIHVNPKLFSKIQYAYEPFTRANLQSNTNVPVATFKLPIH
ncbi:sialate O-acetylesterase [Sphingobacteriaceae bacterium WQ 2009]|uniref:Sialate O-acetylesterase n=1 Tax=Rhinopithecimicrobium faecis TaxID=2820698 RepID=A0A8T4H6F3_9SPHI|nr:sialate O-acetylesterase [Sphingobacteriaceae bacterium WQ 2009]